MSFWGALFIATLFAVGLWFVSAWIDKEYG